MYPFKKGSFAVKNAWYVAAFANEVNRSLLSRNILNNPIVMYRKENGTAVAVSGRCPHRHFPLGESTLEKDDIVCGYHGLTFGDDGSCTRIPTQTNIPKTCKIDSYPLIEHGIWLWIWMGDPSLADQNLLPPLDDIWFNDPDMHFKPGFYMDVKGRYQLLNDNLLDLSHLAFLHGTSIGTLDNATSEEIREEKDRYLSSIRVMKHVEPPAIMADFHPDFEGFVDRTSLMHSYLPGFHAGGEDTFISSDHPDRAGEHIVKGRVFHAVTPGLYNTTNYFFAAALREPEGLDPMFKQLKSVLDEDVFATEEIEKMLLIHGDNLPRDIVLKSDTHAVRGRIMLQKMMDAET